MLNAFSLFAQGDIFLIEIAVKIIYNEAERSVSKMLENIVKAQKDYFMSGKTLSYEARMKALNSLEQSILKHQDEIYQALYTDLNKSETEAFMTEVSIVLSELKFVKRHLRRWMRENVVPTPIAHFSSKSFIVSEPFGTVLIISPWNYPFMLSIDPLVGALCAGNTAVIKPSSYSPATSDLIEKIISDAFDKEYVTVVRLKQGQNDLLLEQNFDFIFFTGSVNVGKKIMMQASHNLTPVVLELGGKNPCVIDETANIKVAADRIAFGKFLNAGQTCVAPDYILIDEKVKDRFLEEIKKSITKMFGENPIECPDFPKIINEKHFLRLKALLENENVCIGGGYNAETNKIAPAIIDGVDENSPLMQDEIFGPLLPVITYNSIEKAKEFILKRDKPLAFYIFTTDRKREREFLREVPFGGGCINDTIIHVASSHLGFGGVGTSGMGKYHGQESFEIFSNHKSVIKKALWFDNPVRYQPYTPIKKKILKKFL